MLLAALLAVTLDPALRMLFARMDPFTFQPRRYEDRLRPLRRHLPRRGRHPVSRAIHRVYDPACHRFVLRRPKTVIAIAW